MKLVIMLVLLSCYGFAQEKQESLLSLKSDYKKLNVNNIKGIDLVNHNVIKLQDAEQSGKKSGFQAILYSLLLPRNG